MNKNLPRIVFFGTASFACACLERLIADGYPVVGVVTAPDKPAGRGHKLQASPIKVTAQELGIPILQPVRLKDPAFLRQLHDLNPTLGVVVAFRMLPEVVWQLPPWGTVNIHGSLLPNYRGAAPINWALIQGEQETGVTLFRLKHDIDTGDIIAASACPIHSEDNFGSLYDRLMSMGADLLSHGLKLLTQYEGNYPYTIPQEADDSTLKHAPKLTRENTRIDWSRSAITLHHLTRGLSPTPCAWTTLLCSDKPDERLIVKIYHTTPCPQGELPIRSLGQCLSPRKGILAIQTGDGYLLIDELQIQGKKRLAGCDWLNGLQYPLDHYSMQ